MNERMNDMFPAGLLGRLLRQGVWLNAVSLVCGGAALAALLLPLGTHVRPSTPARLLLCLSLISWAVQTFHWLRVSFDADLLRDLGTLPPEAAAARLDEGLLRSGLVRALPEDRSWNRRLRGMRRLFALQAGALIVQLAAAAGAAWR